MTLKTGKISLSFRARLMLGIVLVHVALITAFVADVINRQTAFLDKSLTERAFSLGQGIARSATSWALSGDVTGLQESLAAFATYPDVAYAFVVSPDGEVIADTDQTIVGKYVADSRSLALNASPASARVIYNGDDLIDIATPITERGRLIDWVRVGLTRKDTQMATAAVTRIGIFYILAATVIGAAFAFFISSGLTRRLHDLMIAAEFVQAGRRDHRAREGRHDELGKLAQAFNRMLDALIGGERDLQKSAQRLASLNEELEQRFHDRTRDLVALGEQLAIARDAAVERSLHLELAEKIAKLGHWRVELATNAVTWSDEVYHIHGRALGDKPSLVEAIECYHPEDREIVSTAVADIMKNGGSYTFECRLVHADGSIRDVASTGQVVRGPGGEITALFGTFQDITERKDAERERQRQFIELEESYRRLESQREALTRMTEELALARDAANAANDAKSAFLAVMSHELRTPLTGILGSIDILKIDRSATVEAKFLSTLETSAKSLMTLIGDILDFSKIEAGQLTIEWIDCDIRALVATVLDLYGSIAASKNNSLKMIYRGGPVPPMVKADPVRLRQVLSNLISNALKFTASGTVTVTTTVPIDNRSGTPWRFEIRDTGIGIEPSVLARLFTEFTQGDISVTRRFGGTGLGLAIAKRLVEAMGGEIGVESAPDAGSTFWFTVPLMPSDIPPPMPEAEPPPIAPSRRLRVLIAEDNDLNRMIFESLLERLGHTVISVENGLQALEQAAKGGIDAILMDSQMPELDGPSATRRIRDLPGAVSRVAIIGLTADTIPEHVEQFRDAGLSDFLTKPVHIEALRDALQRVLPTLLPSEN